MADPFEELSFLTRSENRVEVLGTLSEGAYTERELVDETGILKVTVGRITEDFLDRGWVRETEEGYEATRFGDLLAEDYARLSEAVSEVTGKERNDFLSGWRQRRRERIYSVKGQRKPVAYITASPLVTNTTRRSAPTPVARKNAESVEG